MRDVHNSCDMLVPRTMHVLPATYVLEALPLCCRFRTPVALSDSVPAKVHGSPEQAGLVKLQ